MKVGIIQKLEKLHYFIKLAGIMPKMEPREYLQLLQALKAYLVLRPYCMLKKLKKDSSMCSSMCQNIDLCKVFRENENNLVDEGERVTD